MVEKILNNTTPYGKIMASHVGSLHSSTLTLPSCLAQEAALCETCRPPGIPADTMRVHGVYA